MSAGLQTQPKPCIQPVVIDHVQSSKKERPPISKANEVSYEVGVKYIKEFNLDLKRSIELERMVVASEKSSSAKVTEFFIKNI